MTNTTQIADAASFFATAHLDDALQNDPNAQPAPVGIALTAADTGKDGIRVVVVGGECFGDRIVWFHDEAHETIATVSADPKTGLPMLSYPLSDRFNAEYRGFETGTCTWWRYAHEADPSEYREHCLRVVRRL